jgi:hypothetical protein
VRIRADRKPGVLLRAGPLSSLSLLAAAISLVWLIAASRWVLSGTVVPWDSKNQFYAFFRFLASAFHSGATPFWNPYHYGGHPSVADPQSLLFAPALALWAWLDATPSMQTFDLVVYGHLLAGGIAMGIIGWRAGWPLPASALAAVIFMLGGPAAGRLQHTTIILSYASFPIALLFLSVTLERVSYLGAVAFGVSAAVLVLGRTHQSLLFCFVLVAVVVGHMLAAPQPGTWMRMRAAVIATMAVITLTLSAIPLLLTVQFAALSNRPDIEISAAHEASLYPANLASMAAANVMGSLETTQAYWGPNYDTLPEVGATDRSFNYLFVGATTTVLLLWLGIAGGGLLRQGNRTLTAVLVVSLLYMLGRYTPLYELAFNYVPGIHLYRRPVDAGFVFVAALALIAGKLLADYVREGVPRVARWRLALVGGGALSILVWAVVFSARTGHGWDSFERALPALGIAALVVAALALARSPAGRIAAASAVALIASGELVWWNAASSLNAEPPAYYASLETPSGQEAEAVHILERELAARAKEGERPRLEIVGVSGPWQNLAMVRHWEATNGYNPLRIGRYDRLVSPGETTHVVDQRLFPPSFNSYDCALARELGLEFVVLGRPIEEVPHLARRPVADVLLSGPKIWIYRLSDPQPRVQFFGRVQVADTDPQVIAGHFGVNPAFETAIVEDDTAPLRSYASLPGESGRAQVVNWAPDRVEVDVESLRPGILVLHELYYPGWTVEVDGQPGRLLRANILFRGVEITEGMHRVVFRYAPFALANLRDAAVSLLHGPQLPPSP